MNHSPVFLALVNDAKKRVHELNVAKARARLATNPKAVLMNVCTNHGWQAGHGAKAVHLGKGIMERDLEKVHPDKDT